MHGDADKIPGYQQSENMEACFDLLVIDVNMPGMRGINSLAGCDTTFEHSFLLQACHEP